MPAIAVIPVKSFSLGKQRLAEALTQSQRASLGKAMVEHVADVVADAGLIPVLVTADPKVATWAAGQAIPSIPDPGQGLNAAAVEGVNWAGHSGARWMILHSDLPLLTTEDLNAFWESAGDGDAIAPSSDGGTSAVTSRATIEFCFGPASFSRHLARLDDPAVFSSTGFLHDIDSPADLEAASAHRRGHWIGQVLR